MSKVDDARRVLPHLTSDQLRNVVATRDAVEAWSASRGLIDGERLTTDGAHVLASLVIRLRLPDDAAAALMELARHRVGVEPGGTMPRFEAKP